MLSKPPCKHSLTHIGGFLLIFFFFKSPFTKIIRAMSVNTWRLIGRMTFTCSHEFESPENWTTGECRSITLDRCVLVSTGTVYRSVSWVLVRRSICGRVTIDSLSSLTQWLALLRSAPRICGKMTSDERLMLWKQSKSLFTVFYPRRVLKQWHYVF